MTAPAPDLSRYRPNVGVVLFHPDGRVWYGRRAGSQSTHSWQFPQGGVDDGETFEVAARRELYEETGVTTVEPLGTTDDWIAYEFPADYSGTKRARGWLGQKQKWFAYRFAGPESEIDLEAHGEIEFNAWRWGRLDEACDLIVPFKRAAYEQVVAAFVKFSG
ncbi:RNA pyrophosphohydrolase [uncultured Brevundimonas sp.]|uniref:RNA pyrophosphohydrolase n=1 Tax=uncultured Brevundimonas sp. TaxID=213418 RepID=UPI0030EDB9FF|tara:strand:+ start:13587 stop:14072 length:486 start_codon:yes stop_codon:yes gene_type:complete